MKLIISLLALIMAFLFAPAKAEDEDQSITMIKCYVLAYTLKLEKEADVFANAYLEIKSIDVFDENFYNNVFFTEGLMEGFAFGTGEPVAKVQRDFYYRNCNGSVLQYAKDLNQQLK